MKKRFVKGILTTAMIGAMFIGGNKLTANAMTIEEFAAWGGLTVEQVKADGELYSFYQDIKGDDISLWMENGSASTGAVTVTVSTSVSHPEMLALVNADRAVNGVGALVWNADLEVIAQQRAIETMAVEQSAEMAAATDVSTQNKLVHSGKRAGTFENELWVDMYGLETAEVANADWISSTGHHSQRIKSSHTQYACASYVDPVTGQETWVEVFK